MIGFMRPAIQSFKEAVNSALNIVFELKELFYLKKILGVIFILLGIAGGFLPFMPGFVFVVLGLSMLSPSIALKIKKLRRRYKCHGSLKRLLKESIDLTQASIKEKMNRMSC